MSELLKAVQSDLRTYLDEKFNPVDYSTWLNKYTKLGGLPFSTRRYPFQTAIINDLHTNLSVIKPSQVGLTEVQYRKACALAYRNPHRNIIFTLPDNNMRKRLYQTRVEDFLKDTAIFNPQGQRPTRSIEINQIAQSYVLFMAANEQAATSQPADVVFNDEVDLSDQGTLALFNSRLQGSDWKMKQKFSTPTYEGFGITADYELSDQHEYMYRCPHCNHYQIPEFNEKFVRIPNLPLNMHDQLHEFCEKWLTDYNIDLSAAHMICEKCQKPMNLHDHGLRSWVAKFPTRNHHRGYRVTPFCSEHLPPSYILLQLFDYQRLDNIKGWYNTVLGMAYESGDQRLSIKEIDRCFTNQTYEPEYDDSYIYFLGSDAGSTCHLVLVRTRDGSHLEYVLFEQIHHTQWESRISELSDKYQVSQGHVDRMPFMIEASRIRDNSGCTIMPVVYVNNKNGRNYEYSLDEMKNVSHANVQRTWMLDQFVKAIRSGNTTFAGYGTQRQLIIEHLRNMVRETNEESVPVWRKLGVADHYFHAMAYAHQAVYQTFDGKNSSNYGNSSLYLGTVSNIKQSTASLYGVGYKPQTESGLLMPWSDNDGSLL